jgi:simple sugar transport system permease protein
MARFLARSRAAWIVVSILAVLLSFVTVGIGLALIGADPIGAFDQMASAAIGSPFAISTTLVKTLPRLLAALGIAIALRAGLWNIGAEGQLYIGAAATAGIALYGPQLGFPLLLVVSLVGGILAGAAWAFIPGYLRAQRGISEVITSLMLVYIAIGIVNYLVEGPWLVPGGTFPASDLVPVDSKLPIIVPKTLLNAGFLIAIGAVLVAWLIMDRSTFGLRLRAVGGNERAAEASGMPVRRTIILALVVSGGFAGLAGAVEVLGTRGRLIEGFSPGYGFEAIAIALLGGLNPFGIAVAATLFGALDAGGAGLQASGSGVPSAVVQLTAALAVIYVLIALGLLSARDRRRQAQEAIERAHAVDDGAPLAGAGVAGG